MSIVGSLLGSPTQTYSTKETSSTKEAEKAERKETNSAPPPPASPPHAAEPAPAPAWLSGETGFAVIKAAETVAEPAAATPETTTAAKPASALVLDGSDAALRFLQDTARDVDTRRNDETKRAEAPQKTPEDQPERSRPRAEKRDEERRDSVFEQRTVNRGFDAYRTGAQPRDAETGTELNARF